MKSMANRKRKTPTLCLFAEKQVFQDKPSQYLALIAVEIGEKGLHAVFASLRRRRSSLRSSSSAGYFLLSAFLFPSFSVFIS
jgi:hypothetical protein